jgi:hypothetical protein|tara:strand:+ start:1038 stop:1535 length:498 start_codon:yes stop_codon:yes gene_type:complete
MARINIKESRNVEARELNTREQDMEYREPNLLDIPENVKDRFANEGMALRWIRINLRGKDDYQNVGRRLQEGWQFVELAEVPEMQHTSFVRDEGRYSGSVCRGDLALAKMPMQKAQNRQKYYEGQSSEMVDAVNQQLMSQSDSRMPIRNNSKTQVTKGRTPSFQS